MTSLSALDATRAVKTRAPSAFPHAAPASVLRERAPLRSSHLLPAHPPSIPVEPAGPLSAQRKLAIGSVSNPLEAEADAMATQVLSGSPAAARPLANHAANTGQPAEAPQSVHDALDSPGQPLDSATRSLMEPRFGRDLGGVRIHTGGRAAESAQAVRAQAYTVGEDVFFGPGRYNPQSSEGKRLLAHELSHTVQQSGGGKGSRLSEAAVAVQRDPVPQSTGKAASQGTTTDTDTKKPKTDQVTVTVPPSLLPRYQLTPPSLLTPPQHPSIFSPGAYSLGGSGTGQTPSLAHPGASLFTPPSQFTPSTSPLAPTAPSSPALAPTGSGSGSATPSAAPKAPDRVSFHDFGPLSVGARIGFPDLSKDTKPGDPPSALQESLKKGEILNFMFTHQPPSEYSIDPANWSALYGESFRPRSIPVWQGRSLPECPASTPGAGPPSSWMQQFFSTWVARSPEVAVEPP